jgi:hypothetical protein
MANIQRNFIAGRMNKSVDERLVPNGEYIDALNIRMGSTEGSEIGVLENSKGNTQLTTLKYNNQALSANARCIGAFDDGANETMYWFIHDSDFNQGKLDMVVSYNVNTTAVVYHLISINDGSGSGNTTLNFNPEYLITGVNKVEDLLFFTDNLNQPREINVKRGYSQPVAGVDGFDYDDILVIKRPPSAAPEVALVTTSPNETFLEERFICFAYRYKYADDEYSATSQWTDPAFSPRPFSFEIDSMLNEGMINEFNQAEVTYNTGGPLVKGIDILFKEADSPTIKIIEKIDKAKAGLTDDAEETFTFTNSKIFTILPESEILRLYDSVPLLSKAQTVMGNRLMYGNYTEGFDLIDNDGNDVRFEYTTSQNSDLLINEDIQGTLSAATYTIDGTVTPDDTLVSFEFDSSIELKSGASLTFSFNFSHDSWTPTSGPTETNGNDNILEFIFPLTRDYANVYDLWLSDEWQEAIGISLPGGNIQPMATAEDGTTLTDLYNTIFADLLNGAYEKYQSGISAIEQAIITTASAGSDVITFQFPAIQYQDNITSAIYTEYLSVVEPNVEYLSTGTQKSLHSNRGYEIGIVYMDEFNRSTPTLVSENNTEHFPCSTCDTANSIDVTIPTTQLAPFWAKKYKFAIKPDRETYETIYSNLYFTEPEAKDTYFLLEGENAAKITDGQRLILKRDQTGPASSCIYPTVLEKEAKEAGFIEVPSKKNPSINLPVPSGVYMKIDSTDFSVESSDDSIIGPRTAQSTSSITGRSPKVLVNLSLFDGTTYSDFDVPIGSTIVLHYSNIRSGGVNRCPKREYQLDKVYRASANYDDIYDWFVGDNIALTLNDGVLNTGQTNVFLNPTPGTPTPAASVGDILNAMQTGLTTNYWQFFRRTSDNVLYLTTTGTEACAGFASNKDSVLRTEVTVYRADETVVFESEPLDASPDIWYESSESFGIVEGTDKCRIELGVATAEPTPIAFNYLDLDGRSQQIVLQPGTALFVNGICGSAAVSPTTPATLPVTIFDTALAAGTHLGNVQDQILSSSTPAICETNFFNCFTFGNGVESYKIRDSAIGKPFALGNRVTSTQANEVEQVNRFADITYSGVYSDESNVNRLNEFNRGLLNFKPLEESFGPVEILFGRETDVLTLQEDKISYVLAGKNLLSDAAGGSTLTSVPQVLGTQIARIEEFGISNNPESFAQWGPDKYFTDAKRGAVLRLTGASGPSDSLEVISQNGMRTWFRDLFLISMDKQKLGGFDPYMNEYVITANQQDLPAQIECVDCDVSQTITVTPETPYNRCFELGAAIGETIMGWGASIINQGDVLDYDVIITYNGNVTQILGSSSGTGTLIFQKDTINVTEVTIQIISRVPMNINFTVGCPLSETISIVEVCVTSPNEEGLQVHNQHRFVDGTYTSPLTSNQVKFGTDIGSPVVSYYDVTTGPQGVGAIPPNGASMTLTFNKLSGDSATFDTATNDFKFLRSSTNYPNTQASIATLLAAATSMTTDTGGAPNTYTGTFTVPNGSNGDFLYLIYDYRKPNNVNLCFGADLESSCCGC